MDATDTRSAPLPLVAVGITLHQGANGGERTMPVAFRDTTDAGRSR